MGVCATQLQRASAFAVVAVIGLALMAQPAAAQGGTPEQRAACEGDAMRLCNQYVPDVNRVSACMSQNRRYLSPRCRAVFHGGAKKKARRARD